jgi:DNA repair protein RadA
MAKKKATKKVAVDDEGAGIPDEIGDSITSESGKDENSSALNEEDLEMNEADLDLKGAQAKNNESAGDVDSLNYSIAELPGVGAATLKKLKDAGYDTLQALVMVPQAVIMEDCGLGEKTAEALIQSARDVLNINMMSAEAVWEKRKNLARITSGNKAIDELLGGGFETGGMTELFGEYRTGKTQLCHQLCLNVQLPRTEGGLDGNALYIDTEGTFRPERLIQMAESKGMDPKSVLKRVFTARAYNSRHQVILIKDAQTKIKENNIKLIIVDSLISHFRSEYIGRGTLANRQQLLNQHIHDLLRMTTMFPELCVIITNQVQSKPDVFFGDPTKAAGGHIMGHAATVRIYLRKGKGDQRVMRIVDAPNLAEGECIFTITEGGIGEAE